VGPGVGLDGLEQFKNLMHHAYNRNLVRQIRRLVTIPTELTLLISHSSQFILTTAVQ
jgi:hypothetical protein